MADKRFTNMPHPPRISDKARKQRKDIPLIEQLGGETPAAVRTVQAWGILWRTDWGPFLLGEGYDPAVKRISPATTLLFHSRREAREFRDKQFAYLKTRPDLQSEPHGWTMPKVVKVEVRCRPIDEHSVKVK